MGAKLKTLFVAGGRDGCNWYRATQPGRVLARTGLVDAVVHTTGDGVNQLSHLLSRSDVVVLGRMRGRALMAQITTLFEEGKAVVYDADDDLFNISPLNNTYYQFGTEEVQVAYPDGSTKILWADLAKADEYPDLEPGRFVDIAGNKADQEALREALGMVDAITVTTPELAQCFREFGPPIFVCPNCIDFGLWQPLDLKRPRDQVRMAWAGGSSHYEDLKLIKGPLELTMENNPGLHFWIQGVHFKDITRGMDAQRIATWGWVDCEAHPYRAAALAPDLAVIPLKDSIFNRRKSPIKFLEYAALGVPSICADMPPYSPVVVHGVNGVLAGGMDAWEHYLDRMVKDSLWRAKLGGRALESCRAIADAEANAPLWVEALEAAIEHRQGRASQGSPAKGAQALGGRAAA